VIEEYAEVLAAALGALGSAADLGGSSLCTQLRGLLQDGLRFTKDSGAGAGGAERPAAARLVKIAGKALQKAFGEQRVHVGEDGVRRKVGQYDFEILEPVDDNKGSEVAAQRTLEGLKCWAELGEARRVLRSVAFRHAAARATTLGRVARLLTAAVRQEAEAAEAAAAAAAASSSGAAGWKTSFNIGGGGVHEAASRAMEPGRNAARAAAKARQSRAVAARNARQSAAKALRDAIRAAAKSPDADTRRAHFTELAAAACDGTVGSGLHQLSGKCEDAQEKAMEKAMASAVTDELARRARTLAPHLACAALNGTRAEGGMQGGAHPLLQLAAFHSARLDHAAAAAAAHKLERSLAGHRYVFATRSPVRALIHTPLTLTRASPPTLAAARKLVAWALAWHPASLARSATCPTAARAMPYSRRVSCAPAPPRCCWRRHRCACCPRRSSCCRRTS